MRSLHFIDQPVSVDSQVRCPICLDNKREISHLFGLFKEQDYFITHRNSNHTFHRTCFKQYFEDTKNPTCPTCRADIGNRIITPLRDIDVFGALAIVSAVSGVIFGKKGIRAPLTLAGGGFLLNILACKMKNIKSPAIPAVGALLTIPLIYYQIPYIDNLFQTAAAVGFFSIIEPHFLAKSSIMALSTLLAAKSGFSEGKMIIVLLGSMGAFSNGWGFPLRNYTLPILIGGRIAYSTHSYGTEVAIVTSCLVSGMLKSLIDKTKWLDGVL